MKAKNKWMWFPVLFLLVVDAGCEVIKVSGPKGYFDHESVAREMAVELNKAAAVLNGVTTKEKARRASRKLDAIYGRMAEIYRKTEGKPEPTPEQVEAMEEILRQPRQNMIEAQRKVVRKAQQYPSIGPMIAGPAFKAFDEIVKSRQGWRGGQRRSGGAWPRSGNRRPRSPF